MAVTVISTKGAPDANAYVSVAEADAYLDTVYLAEEWATLDADVKGRLLISAARLIDALPVVYAKADDAQELAFPVKVDSVESYPAPTSDGYDLAQRANIIQALYLYKFGETASGVREEMIQGITTQRLGSTGFTKATAGVNPLSEYDPKTLSLLSDFYDFSCKNEGGHSLLNTRSPGLSILPGYSGDFELGGR